MIAALYLPPLIGQLTRLTLLRHVNYGQLRSGSYGAIRNERPPLLSAMVKSTTKALRSVSDAVSARDIQKSQVGRTEGTAAAAEVALKNSAKYANCDAD